MKNLKDYSLDSLIETNEFADIYIGKELENNEIYTIYVIHLSLINLNEKDFFELNLLKVLQSNNVQKLINSFKENNCFYLVFEYIPYNLHNFFELHEENIFDEKTVKIIMYKIVKGIKHLHLSFKIFYLN